MHQALFYKKIENNSVECTLCAHRCLVKPGKLGICNVRLNTDGELYTLVYNMAAAAHVDPIEKKPLFHFYPGSKSLSVSTMGCNFHCAFCQNWTISQVQDPKHIEFSGKEIKPDEIVRSALNTRSRSIAYTYTEPTIFFEYAFDTAKLAAQQGIKNIFVTNGYMSAEPLKMIAPFLDAANVDLKSYSDKTYRRIIGAAIAPVLDSLLLMKKLNIWIEVTTLIIPGINDSDDEIRDIAGFISTKLGTKTPWHISRFHPDHKLAGIPPTPSQTLQRASQIGRGEGLRFVYTGNLPGGGGENTNCSNCGKTIIERFGFQIISRSLENGKCIYCKSRVNGVGM